MRAYPKKADERQSSQDMRRKVIAMLMSWKPEQFGSFDTARMRHVPDMTKIYEWINTYGHRHPKWLNKYSYKELVTLVSQIEKIIKTKKTDGIQKRPKGQKRRDKTDIPVPAQSRETGKQLRDGRTLSKLSSET